MKTVQLSGSSVSHSESPITKTWVHSSPKKARVNQFEAVSNEFAVVGKESSNSTGRHILNFGFAM